MIITWLTNTLLPLCSILVAVWSATVKTKPANRSSGKADRGQYLKANKHCLTIFDIFNTPAPLNGKTDDLSSAKTVLLLFFCVYMGPRLRVYHLLSPLGDQLLCGYIPQNPHSDFLSLGGRYSDPKVQILTTFTGDINVLCLDVCVDCLKQRPFCRTL